MSDESYGATESEVSAQKLCSTLHPLLLRNAGRSKGKFSIGRMERPLTFVALAIAGCNSLSSRGR